MAHILQPKLVLNFQFFCRSLLEVQSIDVYYQTSQYSASLLAHSSSAEDLLCAHDSLRAVHSQQFSSFVRTELGLQDMKACDPTDMTPAS